MLQTTVVAYQYGYPGMDDIGGKSNKWRHIVGDTYIIIHQMMDAAV
jgi:hypothetical protein